MCLCDKEIAEGIGGFVKTDRVCSKRVLQRNQAKRLILTTIKHLGPLSRLDLAKHTHIRPSTITLLVGMLMREGLLKERGPGRSTGGRRPVFLELNAGARMAIGIHLAKERILAVALDLRANIVSRTMRQTSLTSQEMLISEIIKVVGPMIQGLGVNSNNILGIGIGVPGVIDRDKGLACRNTFFPWWRDIPIRTKIETAFHVPVMLENDTKVLTLAEMWFGCGKAIRNMLFVEVSEGIASGIIIRGELYYGAHGLAGELGHAVIDEQGELCVCGRRGCLETKVSYKSLLSAAQGWPEMNGLTAKGNNYEPGIARLISLAQSGHEKARRLIEGMGEHLGVALVNAIHFANPDLIVIGGRLGVDCRAILAPVLERIVREQVLDRTARSTPVVFSQLGEDGGARGAAGLALGMLLDMNR